MEFRIVYDEESQSWKPYEEPYKTIECRTEAAYQFLVDALEHYKKRGRWIHPLPKPYNQHVRRCSVCESTQGYGMLKYCPNCGAKMDKRKEDDIE